MSQKIAAAKELQNTHILKCPKTNLRELKVLILVCAMVCCVYVYATFVKQTHDEEKRGLYEFQVSGRPRFNDVYRSPFTYLHYPNPEALNRVACVIRLERCKNPMRLFVIVSMQRSGSGWFETLMNSHLNVSSNGEIFGQKHRRQNVSMIINTLNSVYNLDLPTSSSKNDCSAAIGFKWMLNQGLMDHPEDILDYFIKRDVYIIFFLRRNMLRRLVSILANSFDKKAKLLKGVHVSHVHSQEEALTLSRYKPTVNVTSLAWDLGKMESTVIRALEYYNSTRHIVVYYEDLIKNPNKLIHVEDFLKLPIMKLKSRQVKIHKGPLSEQINNEYDVIRTLSGTKYERYFRADY